MTPLEQQVLGLHVEGHSYKQIANLAGISKTSAFNIIAAAKAKPGLGHETLGTPSDTPTLGLAALDGIEVREYIRIYKKDVKARQTLAIHAVQRQEIYDRRQQKLERRVMNEYAVLVADMRGQYKASTWSKEEWETFNERCGELLESIEKYAELYLAQEHDELAVYSFTAELQAAATCVLEAHNPGWLSSGEVNVAGAIDEAYEDFKADLKSMRHVDDIEEEAPESGDEDEDDEDDTDDDTDEDEDDADEEDSDEDEDED